MEEGWKNRGTKIRKEIFGFVRRVIPFFHTSVASCLSNFVPNLIIIACTRAGIREKNSFDSDDDFY